MSCYVIMSLLKRQVLAKSKTDLGQKINAVHDTILQHDLGQKTSQESLGRVFKHVTTKLDDVILSNLVRRGQEGQRATQIPDYGLGDDHVEAAPDYALDELFSESKPKPNLIDFAEPVPRIGPKPQQSQDQEKRFLKRLELIAGEILAGNTSTEMRNRHSAVDINQQPFTI